MIAAAFSIATALAQQNPYLGRWNITGTGENTGYVYWLEVKQDGGKLSGMLLTAAAIARRCRSSKSKTAS